ncbi:Putative AC9 transposase-like protein [Cladobotryum mycophilum]|uniref:AC9 transposase-like protein n=1 Tax=Cladobotryum mycophilum TaxID=491253 RepID=A0ABR0SGE7_9HYPO
MSLTIFNKQRRLGLISQLQNATDAASASESDLTGRDGLESLPFATYGGKRYVLEKHITKKGSRSQQINWSRDSQRKQLDRVFDNKKGEIQSELRKALTQIHLGFDLWTSPNRLAILGVTGHFLSSNGSQQQRLLALKQHPGAHSGEKLTTTLKEVIYDWGIQDQLGTIILDNASNNDTCLLHLFNALDPSMTEEDIGERRIRCYGHILNLIARAYLYSQDNESFKQESQLHILADHLDDDLKHWRKKSPIGKLHNIVKFIRASPQRTEEFKKSVLEDYNDGDFMLVNESDRELELIINNETRWNSTYLMIERALGKNGNHGRLWEIITGFEFLLTHFEHWKTYFTPPTDEEIKQTQSQIQSSISTQSRRTRPSQHNRPSLRSSRSMQSDFINSLPEHTRKEYTTQTQRINCLRGIQGSICGFLSQMRGKNSMNTTSGSETRRCMQHQLSYILASAIVGLRTVGIARNSWFGSVMQRKVSRITGLVGMRIDMKKALPKPHHFKEPFNIL